MAKPVKMRAPKGTDQVNHGDTAYVTDKSGNVEVPAEAVAPLLAVGGFVAEDESDEDPTGFVRVKHSGDATALSWRGDSYAIRADGSFLVPAVSAFDLLDHGFSADHRPEAAQPSASARSLKIPTK